MEGLQRLRSVSFIPRSFAVLTRCQTQITPLRNELSHLINEQESAASTHVNGTYYVQHKHKL
jgi:hypothetical protein